MTPRTRNLLRQAQRVADSGKRTAAQNLYQEILEEAPEVPEVWVGLSRVLTDEDERRAAISKALKLAPDHKPALKELDILDGRAEPEVKSPTAPIVDNQGPPPAASPTSVAGTEPARQQSPPSDQAVVANHEHAATFEKDPKVGDAEAQPLVCYRHPDSETNLRCNRCDRPICIKCANRTSVGYRCPECLREIESEFFTAKTSDYLVASAVALPLSIVAGVIVTLFGGGFGFFIYFIVAALGSGVGTFIARLAHRAIGRRRGRYMPRLVAGIVALGAVLPALVIRLPLLFVGGGLGVLFTLLLPIIYGFVAASAAFYWLR